MLGSVNQLAVTMGILLATVFGVFCNWKWLALAGGLFPALLVIFMVKMPETPRWCFGKNQRTEAVRYIHWLRGSGVDIEEECKAIESSLGKNYTFCHRATDSSPTVSRSPINQC